jgi:uncharacterized membrane protein
MAKRKSRRSSAERRIRAQELKREKDREQMKKLLIVVVLIAIVAVAWITFGGGDDSGMAPADELQVNTNGELELPVAEITKAAQYYSIDANGVEVRFFTLRGQDGKVRVAMDACDVCYDRKRGYRQEGNDMVCNNCGNRYDSEGIGTENIKGGCWPSYVPFSVKDGNMLIKSSDVKAKRYMFS